MKRLRIVSGSLVLVGISVFALGVFTLLRVALNVSHVPDIVTYYAECKQERLSEAAFLCAANVFDRYRSTGYAHVFDTLSDTNKVDAATRRKAIQEFIRERNAEIVAAASNYKRSIFRYMDILNDPDATPDEIWAANANYDVFLRLKRELCYLRRGHDILIEFFPDAPREEVHEYLEDRFSDSLDGSLRQINPVDAEFIIQCHKIIIQDWRKHREEYLKDAR